MRTLIIIAALSMSAASLGTPLTVSSSECIIKIDDQFVTRANEPAVELTATFASGGHTHFIIPKSFWPPEDERVYRWRRPGCASCKQKMVYKKGELHLSSSRQSFTLESEDLSIKTDLNFQRIESAKLREGISIVPIQSFSCQL